MCGAPEVFLLPEPYHKGWSGLFGGLRRLIRDTKFEDWVFVFGTAVSAAVHSVRFRKSAYPSTYFKAPATCYNSCLVMQGGKSPDDLSCQHVVRKHLKSHIDFIAFNLEHVGFFNKKVSYDSVPEWEILDRFVAPSSGLDDSGSLFLFEELADTNGAPITFGVEICLDHAASYMSNKKPTATTGRLAANGKPVRIQLVVSCGMQIIPTSLCLEKTVETVSYACLCDGHIQNSNDSSDCGGTVDLYTFHHADAQYQQVDFTAGSSVEPVKGDVLSLQELGVSTPILNGLWVNDITADKLWSSKDLSFDENDKRGFLWPEGAGCIYCMPTYPLSENK